MGASARVGLFLLLFAIYMRVVMMNELPFFPSVFFAIAGGVGGWLFLWTGYEKRPHD